MEAAIIGGEVSRLLWAERVQRSKYVKRRLEVGAFDNQVEVQRTHRLVRISGPFTSINKQCAELDIIITTTFTSASTTRTISTATAAAASTRLTTPNSNPLLTKCC